MHQEELTKEPTAQPTILPLVPMNQEGTMVERVKPAPERSEHERTNLLVIEAEAALAVPIPEAAPPITLMPIPALATASQDMPITPTTSKFLLLLTSGPQLTEQQLQLVLLLPSPQLPTLTSYLLM